MEYQEMMRGLLFAVLSALIASSVITGCAAVRDMHQKFIESLRQPGENMERGPEETLQYYPSCTEQSMPPLFETEVVPEHILPGKEINLRLRYSTCLSAASASQKGKILRTVFYKNNAIFRDRTEYEFKPGTWTVDAFIKVPDNAVPGGYVVESVIIYRDSSLKKKNSFEVRAVQEDK
ncbi:MAG TPA: hypothetical protein VMB78_01355 [Dissulfurispiraceae bacterium]|nr:hypothetical protein [Dissulfurispiraceae bacterium]